MDKERKFCLKMMLLLLLMVITAIALCRSIIKYREDKNSYEVEYFEDEGTTPSLSKISLEMSSSVNQLNRVWFLHI